MRDVFLLIDACCDAYDELKYKPIPDDPKTLQNERATFCNQAVNQISIIMGFTKFQGLVANQMVKLMQGTDAFFKCSVDEAQGYANAGHLVIAGKIDLPHGHVVVIRPGKELYSEKWKKVVPRIINIGATNFINHNLGYCFKEEPEIFVWKGKNDVDEIA